MPQCFLLSTTHLCLRLVRHVHCRLAFFRSQTLWFIERRRLDVWQQNLPYVLTLQVPFEYVVNVTFVEPFANPGVRQRWLRIHYAPLEWVSRLGWDPRGVWGDPRTIFGRFEVGSAKEYCVDVCLFDKIYMASSIVTSRRGYHNECPKVYESFLGSLTRLSAFPTTQYLI